MDNTENYVGIGWQNDYGVNISVNLEKLNQLPKDSYGNVKLFVGKRKEVDAKSKATHWIKESKPKQ